jgi:RNA polymerase sigma-32 factor
MLEAQHEHDLAVRWKEQQDEDALHELTGAYMRLVIAMAGRFKAYGLPHGDLIQEGSVGLMQAAARFEPDRAVRFSTYAGWWVRAAMQDYVLRNWSIVRTGTTAARPSRRHRRPADGGGAGRHRHRTGRRRRGCGSHGLAAFGVRPLAQRPDHRRGRGRLSGLPAR